MSTLTYKLVDAVGDAAKGHKLKIGLRIRMCGESTPDTELIDDGEGPAEITFKVLNKSNSKILSGKCTLKRGPNYWFSSGENGDEPVGSAPQLCIIIDNDFSIRTCVGSLCLDQRESYRCTYIPENLIINELGLDLVDQTIDGNKLVIEGGVSREYNFTESSNAVFAMEPFFYTDVDQF